MSFPQCKDFLKPKPDYANEVEVELYHVTSDLESVCKEGLKPRCEIDNSCGLGGGRDDLVSFTYDRKAADIIYEGLEDLLDISKGDLDWESIEGYVKSERLFKDKYKGKNGLDLWNDLFKEWIKNKYDFYGKNEEDEYKQESLFRYRSYANPKTVEEWETYLKKHEYHGENIGKCYVDEGWVKRITKKMDFHRRKGNLPQLKEMEKFIDENKYDQIKCENIAQSRDDLFDLYRMHYLWDRGKYGGRFDPLFWGVGIENFEGKEQSDLGIIKVKGYLPHSINVLKTHKKLCDTASYVSEVHLDIIKPPSNIYEMCGSVLNEIRLRKDRFNKLEIIKHNYPDFLYEV
ncbi:hypothetical protein LCGC14_0885760 [marine sediment metagenome]|uniref:Uncharacterized protein n=1 Tax=marine sediment metagenome TaxID=412755 RepID=A0A0F9P5P0_9ZZZZ